MSRLLCPECPANLVFTQVSAKGDARDVHVTPSGLRTGSWDRRDARPPGIFCGDCDRPLEAPETDELADTRLPAVAPTDFDAARLADEIERLRPDVTWKRLHVPGRPPSTRDTSADLHPAVAQALERSGRLPLYTHQAEAIERADDGANVVQATSTGSGKTVGFLAPVLDVLLGGERATALLIYPMRALINDQLHNLRGWAHGRPRSVSPALFDVEIDEGAELRFGKYDGSVARKWRREVRRTARVILATPDMVHLSMLGAARFETRTEGEIWARFLRGLRYVVLDEVHTYRGTFGSNVAQVFRRLRRMANYFDADPQFLAASATVGNPLEHTEALTGLPFELVDDDGSPRAERLVLVGNPPFRDGGSGDDAGDSTADDEDATSRRQSPGAVAVDVLARAALASDSHGAVRSICFARSRVEVFDLEERLRGLLRSLGATDVSEVVTAYAGTFTSEDRKEAEDAIRDGSTLAVISTNALELGIDIPALSLGVLCGYPGQSSSYRQRAGRVGRVGEGLVLLLLGDSPLQQYIANDPERLRNLLEQRPEDVVINPDSFEVVRRFGLAPGQQELGGIATEDATYFGEEAVEDWLAGVVGAPSFRHGGKAYFELPLGEDEDVFENLRSNVSGEPVVVVTRQHGSEREVGRLDRASAARDAFVPAVWRSIDGRYRVREFDLDRNIVICEPTSEPILTRGIPEDTIKVVYDLEPAKVTDGTFVGYASLEVTRTVESYLEMRPGSDPSWRRVRRAWPSMHFQTEGLRIDLDPDWVDDLGDDAEDAIRGLEHLCLSLAPRLVACDVADLESRSVGRSMYLYDTFGGELGTARPVFERFDELVELARDVVANCPCGSGCPACVVLARRPNDIRGVSKVGAQLLLERWGPPAAV